MGFLTSVPLLILIACTLVNGECAVGSVQLFAAPIMKPEARDYNKLLLPLVALTIGGEPTQYNLTRNGIVLSNTNPISGVPNSQVQIGEVEPASITTDCTSRKYRVLMELLGYVPGVYIFTVINAHNAEPATSTPYTVPVSDPPSNLTLCQVNGTRMHASWTAPSNDIIDYRIFVNELNTSTDGIILDLSSTTYTTGISFGAGEVVNITVRATTSIYWSAPITSSIIIGPIQIHNLTAIPQLLSVYVTWLPELPDEVIIQYTISYSINGNAPVMYTSSRNRFTISGLHANTTVSDIIVFSTTCIGPGLSVALLDNITATGLPEVQSVTVEVLSSTSVRVSWNRLDITEITHYLVHYRQTANKQIPVNSPVQVPATQSSVVISNLDSGREYEFEVVAQVILNGAMFVGPTSDSMNAVLPSVSSSEVRGGIIAAVIVVVLVFSLSIIILVLVGITCYCYKQKMRNKPAFEGEEATNKPFETMNEPEKSNMIDPDVDIQFVKEGSTPHYASDSHQDPQKI